MTESRKPPAQAKPIAADGESTGTGGGAAGAAVVDSLLEGSEDAFRFLVARHHLAMVRLAMAYVPSRAVAEEVAQETWVALLQGLTSFRGRSSLKTWLFGILLNRAKSRGLRESRSVSLSTFDAAREGTAGVEEVALREYDAAAPKTPWVWGQCSRDAGPEGRLLSGELQRCLEAAIGELPPTHRAVVTLRDIEGWSSAEVCQVLEITPINQRVILHRARQRIRNALVSYLERQ